MVKAIKSLCETVQGAIKVEQDLLHSMKIVGTLLLIFVLADFHLSVAKLNALISEKEVLVASEQSN